MEIKDTVAVVTGAASGIGQAVAVELARRGAKAIALVDQTPVLEETESLIRKACDGTVVVDRYVGDVANAVSARKYSTVSRRLAVWHKFPSRRRVLPATPWP